MKHEPVNVDGIKMTKEQLASARAAPHTKPFARIGMNIHDAHRICVLCLTAWTIYTGPQIEAWGDEIVKMLNGTDD